MSEQQQPCECVNWARVICLYGRDADGIPIDSNHHPNCERYEDSLIDVWEVMSNGKSYWTTDKEDADEVANQSQESGITVMVIPTKVPKECYERLPEFDGF